MGIPGPLQSYRLYSYGSSIESLECCPLLRDRNPSNIFAVCLITLNEYDQTLIPRRYQYVSPAHLINRLTSRNLHLLALRVSSFLSLKPDVVLKHWASAKIGRPKSSSADGQDDEVCRIIVDKFEKLGGGEVSYADIARRAWEVGRTGLATKVKALIVIVSYFQSEMLHLVARLRN
jgi:hypothetical protein